MDKFGSGEDGMRWQQAAHDLSLSLIELAADALDLIVVIWQLEDELVCFSNRWAQRAHGVDRPTYLETMEVRALIHPNDHAELDAAIDSCLDNTGTIVQASFRIRLPSGWLPVHARCRAMAFDEGGRVTRIVAMLTEIKEFEALRKLKKRDQRDLLSMALPGSYRRPAEGGASAGRDPAFSRFLEWHGRIMKMVLQGG